MVVNNAGAGSRRCGVEAADGPGVRLRKLMGPNLEAAYYVSAYAMPALKAAGGGAIVNISSPPPSTATGGPMASPRLGSRR